MKRIKSTCLLGLVIPTLAACAAVADGPIQVLATPAVTPPPATSTAVQWFPSTATLSPHAPPTRQPTPDKKPGVAGVLLRDDFSSASVWNTAVSDQAAVTITGSGLTMAVQPGIAPVVSFRQGEVFANMYAEITAHPSLCRGADDYGLAFRAPNNIAYYRFSLACNGTTGADRASRGDARVLQPPILSADVPLGAPGEVRLGVWALGSEFRFFLNGRYQFTAVDKSYGAGAIGVFAYAAGSTPVIVTFSDLIVSAVTASPSSAAPTP
jgi:hypothetical protein